MSGKSVAERLLSKKGYKVYVIDPPPGYMVTIQAQAREANISDKRVPAPDLIQLFVSSDAELRKKLPLTKGLLSPQVVLWVAYPKGTSKLRADLNRDTIRAYAEGIGLEAVSLIAIDDVWSALRLKLR